ncbi:histone-lysine N-methyltransferase SMYD3-like isoform X2 [Pomacea canaliculata]|uniref:histone-lysine N-methyltransferase SMYD3-like isoform X2 n=1 Tax=Pomacea canaliculata TaxID=400727 RepID=UPI000D725917|nr:histone-lysine N-methyltransferase SMYD3-like isoform X2 [Pomacea canaliculata]
MKNRQYIYNKSVRQCSGNMGYKKGDVIMTSEPYAHVLALRHRSERCSYCLMRSADLKRCTACTQLRYCSKKCQRADWSVHKLECQCLKKVAPNTPTDSVLLMLRLVLKYLSGDHLKKVYGDPGLRTFAHMMSHAEEIKKDAQRCEAFAKICHTLALLAGSHITLPSNQELLDIFGKMVVNTITIATEDLHESLGAGIYLSPSLLDHRCSPNSVMTFQGKSLRLSAVENIACDDITKVADHVFVSYIDQLAPSWVRQAQLKEQYYFLCTCPRCANPSLDQLMTSGIKEEAETTDGKCVSREGKTEAERACQDLLQTVSDMHKSGASEEQILSLCEECLSKVKHQLPPFNVSHLRVLDCALDAAIRCGMWEQALSYVVVTLQPYKTLYPAMSPNTGLMLMRAGKLQLYLGHTEEASVSLREAEAILSVTHGQQSDLYQELRDLLDQCREGSELSQTTSS